MEDCHDGKDIEEPGISIERENENRAMQDCDATVNGRTRNSQTSTSTQPTSGNRRCSSDEERQTARNEEGSDDEDILDIVGSDSEAVQAGEGKPSTKETCDGDAVVDPEKSNEDDRSLVDRNVEQSPDSRGAVSGMGDSGGKSKKGKPVVKNPKSRWRHWYARRDMRHIIDTGNLKPGRKVKMCFTEETLRETVRYILQTNNVQLLSWGTRRLYIHGERRQFPVLVRKVGMEVMWRCYERDKTGYPPTLKKVGRTLFCDIVYKLTKGDVKQRDFVDYKLHGLVYENTDIIKRIIDDHVRDVEKRKQLKKQLKGVCEFLKYSYITHLNEASNDPMHNIKFALDHSTLEKNTMVSVCDECNAVFKYLKDVKKSIIDLSVNIQKIWDESATKFQLFMWHIVSKKFQEDSISELFEWLRAGRPNRGVIVYIDYKMKVEPQRFRESTIQYYGKAGMSLYGSAVFLSSIQEKRS